VEIRLAVEGEANSIRATRATAWASRHRQAIRRIRPTLCPAHALHPRRPHPPFPQALQRHVRLWRHTRPHGQQHRGHGQTNMRQLAPPENGRNDQRSDGEPARDEAPGHGSSYGHGNGMVAPAGGHHSRPLASPRRGRR
jgi:hypothetical protein